MPAALVAIIAAAAMLLPSAPHKQVITLSPVPGSHSEPAVAINPRNPRNVIVAYQTDGNAVYTRDGGKTWRTVSAIPRDHKVVAGDVSLAFDTRGDAVLCYIAFDRLGSANYWAHGGSSNGIFVVRSTDGGAHWSVPETVIAKALRNAGAFEDKPYVVADHSKSAFRNSFYIGWTDFRLGFSRMLFSRSTDGGRHWSAPAALSALRGSPRDDNGALEGFDGTTAADGALYSVWQDGTHLLLSVSNDGGRSFAPARIVQPVPSMYFEIAGYSGRGGNGFPQIAAGPRTGTLFVAWADYRNGEVDVFVSTSSDRGSTWSAPVKVNGDPVHDARDHYFQWLALDPVTGDVYVLFKDRRGDVKNELETVTLARSSDGGRSFANYALTTTGNDPAGHFMGDYDGLAAWGGRVYGVWTEAAPAKGRRMPTVVRLGMAQFNIVHTP
ncbi:MAG TPA: sialidase family protein [Candidatus Baltobacteraceae bacterium]|jgi:hypothetical protein|nr:sialidase family protein [Candidatus Baltobacteraceae bacterium]